MSEREYTETDGVVRLFGALAHPVRASIVHRLTDGAADVSTLTDLLGVSQPLVSHHLRTLREAHLIEGTKDGRRTMYRLVDTHVAHIYLDAHQHMKEHQHDCRH